MSFIQTQETIKRIGAFTTFLAVLCLLFYLVIAVGVIFLITYELTHWMNIVYALTHVVTR